MATCASCSASTPQHEPRCVRCDKDPALQSPRGERYLLRHPIGRAPMRVTWQATRTSDKRTVVIKECHLPYRADAKVRELVEREAAMLQSLDHPQIPHLIEHWIAKEMTSWLVLEHIEGTDLEKWSMVSRFEEHEVAEILIELCGVLSFLHGRAAPVLHRDLKPANVVRRLDGRLVLIDFGAARAGLTHGQMTTVVGTMGYMAPEQHDGLATVQSDIYGLGALALALLTGKDLFSLTGRDGRPGWQDRVDIAPAFVALLEEMLSVDPASRPGSVETVRKRLAKLPRARRGPWMGAILLACALGAWMIVLLMVLSSGLTLFAAIAL